LLSNPEVAHDKISDQELFMELTVAFVVGAILIGGLIGFLTGVFGVGGGFMLTPLLMIVLGVPPQVAVSTGLAVILVNSSYGLFVRRGSNTVDGKLSLMISIGSVAGVLVGAQLLTVLAQAPSLTVLGREQDAAQYALLVIFLVLLSWIAGYLYYDTRKHGGETASVQVGILASVKLPPYGRFASLDEPRLSVPALVVLGLVVGLLTGLLGVGGGVVLLPALVYLVGQRAAKAAGTSLLLVWIASATGVIRMAGESSISLSLLGILLVGGFSGTTAGTRLGLTLSGSKIRLYFVFVVLAAVALVVYELLKVTFL
jgi:uncharacterized protein